MVVEKCFYSISVLLHYLQYSKILMRFRNCSSKLQARLNHTNCCSAYVIMEISISVAAFDNTKRSFKILIKINFFVNK